MHLFTAIIDRARSHHGALQSCLYWAQAEVGKDPKAVAKVVKVRAGEKEGRIVAEITIEGCHIIQHGRITTAKHIRRRQRRPAGTGP